MAYNWTDDNIADSIYNTLESMSPEQRGALPNAKAFLPEGVYLSRWAEIDEPFLIEFEDGDVLAIDYSEGMATSMALKVLCL